MEIVNIKELPVFISKYMEDKKDSELQHMLDSFKKFILNREVSSYVFTDSLILLEYTLDDHDYNIRYFANYYLEKSSLNNKYECSYESDLGIAKSVSNEVFIVSLKASNHIEDDINIIIDSCDKNRLFLKCV